MRTTTKYSIILVLLYIAIANAMAGEVLQVDEDELIDPRNLFSVNMISAVWQCICESNANSGATLVNVKMRSSKISQRACQDFEGMAFDIPGPRNTSDQRSILTDCNMRPTSRSYLVKINSGSSHNSPANFNGPTRAEMESIKTDVTIALDSLHSDQQRLFDYVMTRVNDTSSSVRHVQGELEKTRKRVKSIGTSTPQNQSWNSVGRQAPRSTYKTPKFMEGGSGGR